MRHAYLIKRFFLQFISFVVFLRSNTWSYTRLASLINPGELQALKETIQTHTHTDDSNPSGHSTGAGSPVPLAHSPLLSPTDRSPSATPGRRESTMSVHFNQDPTVAGAGPEGQGRRKKSRKSVDQNNAHRHWVHLSRKIQKKII